MPSIARYPHFRSTGFRLLNLIRSVGGKAFYYGREKISGTTAVNSIGLYTTILGHTIRQLEDYCSSAQLNYVMVVDEHSARKELLATASKTMFGENPARRLLSPPFEVESYINQNIQAADWLSLDHSAGADHTCTIGALKERRYQKWVTFEDGQQLGQSGFGDAGRIR